MNLLITGGAGYLGSVLTKNALERGHRVTVLDKMYYLTPLVEQHLKGAELVEADVCRFGGIDGDYDWCFHLAAMSNDPSADLDPDATFRVNIEGSEAVGTYCAERGIPMIFASTASVYGFVEWELCREDTRVNPQSTYAESKAQAEARLQNLAGLNSLRCITLRQATLFGWSPRMRYDLVVNTLLANAVEKGRMVAHGAGECWRPLLYVGDAAECWLKLAEMVTDEWWSAQGTCPTFNLIHHENGRTKNYRVSELVHWMQWVLEQRGVPCEVELDRSQAADRRSYSMDGSRAQHFGLSCAIGITHAVEEMLAHIANGEAADFSNPIYRNVEWMKVLQRARERVNLWELIP